MSARKFSVTRVKLDKGGYDASGRYWGVGSRLYFCPEIAEIRSPLFYQDAWIRAVDVGSARSLFASTLQGLVKSL